jgi:short-subunit dehydrogenase
MAAGDLSGKRALVTGASSGIGASVARELAARGCHLAITARRVDRLETLAAELRKAHPIEVVVIGGDLGAPGGEERVWRTATDGGPIDVLVNNAGFGHFRPFADVAPERDLEMLQLNVASLVALTHRFVAQDLSRGWILNVASIAAYQSVPYFASYAASKAFVRNFSEALHYELRARGTTVTCLCPGGTHTEFHGVAGAGDYGAIANASMLSAEKVAAIGVRAMLRGRKTVVSGVMNKLSCFFVRFVPRGLASRAAVWLTGRPKTAQLPDRTSAPP